jgi:exodeoxyribonuclease V
MTIETNTGATVVPLHSELKLTAGQQRAFDLINQAARDGRSKIPFAVISGYAGTGKTTLLRLAKPLRPLLIAPTGKAALRLQEATGQKASTIHRAFKTAVENPNDPDGDPIFLDKSAAVPPDCKAILVDESSMVTEDLCHDLLEHGRRLDLPVVFIGDPFQLPPVDPGKETPFSVFKMGTPHRTELTEVLRQAQDNPIIAASMRIREGDARTALRVFERVPVGQLANACALAFMQGGTSIVHKNATRGALNRRVRGIVGFTEQLLLPDEPLLVTFNNYSVDLFNGEITRFKGWRVPPVLREVDGRGVNVGVARLENGKEAWLCLEEVTGLIDQRMGRRLQREMAGVTPDGFDEPPPFLHANYGYVLTAHKSQGSEWPDVIVVMESSVRLHTLEGCQWLYTSLTRARRSVRIGSWG